MLTEEQRKAVETDERHAVVLAAAGSGKTTLLTHRIGHLVDKGVPPEAIMAITFTRNAAKELRLRLDAMGCRGVNTGTFHSLILRAMQSIGQTPHVLDEEDSGLIIDDCAEKIGLAVNGKYTKKSRGHYRKLIEAYRNGKAELEPIVSSYLSRLNINGDIDYQGILCKGIEILDMEDSPFRTVQYLLVDECQDNELLQWEFVLKMSKTAGVMAVGDVAQSLYAFRGATPQELERIPWPRFEMSETFRCPSNVVDLANRLPLESISMRSGKAPGVVAQGSIDFLSMVEVMSQAHDPESIGVLCRYNEQVSKYKQMLSDAGYPVSEVILPPRGALYRLIKFLANPGNVTARQRLRNEWGYAADIKPILWALSDMEPNVVYALTSNWVAGSGKTVGEVLDQLSCPRSLSAEYEYYRQFSNLTLKELEIEEADLTHDATSGISVMTIHGSKGLEWPAVIIPDLDTWPKSDPKPEDIRLFYVAMTRTMGDIAFLHQGESKLMELIK